VGLVVLVVFWATAIKLWVTDGPKVPLVFIAFWVIGYVAFPMLGLGGYAFLAFEAILAAILLLVDQYKSAM
jgi:hypothetical protein